MNTFPISRPRNKERNEVSTATMSDAPVKEPLNGELSLTPKQEHFATLVACGLSASEACRQAYGVNWKPESVHVRASRLMANANVKRRIDQLRASMAAEIVHDGARIREHVISRLLEESMPGKGTASSRIRALELLGKLDILQAFDDSKAPTEDRRSSAELEKEILDRLSRMLGGKLH